MDIIEMTRALCKELQKDARYIAYIAARDANDSDAALQAKIDAFTAKRTEINMAMSGSDSDAQKLQKLNTELKAIYDEIFQNENMIRYNAAKNEMDDLLRSINMIISESANGENPDEIDPAAMQQGCSGSCSSCSGCH